MKFHDISVDPRQIAAVAEWIDPEGADVELLVDDRMLVVGQGDAKTAFDLDGSVGSDEYVALAPLDRTVDALDALCHERALRLRRRLNVTTEHFAGVDENPRWAAVQQDAQTGDYFLYLEATAADALAQLADGVLDGWMPHALISLADGKSYGLHVSTPIVTVSADAQPAEDDLT